MSSNCSRWVWYVIGMMMIFPVLEGRASEPRVVQSANLPLVGESLYIDLPELTGATVSCVGVGSSVTAAVNAEPSAAGTRFKIDFPADGFYKLTVADRFGTVVANREIPVLGRPVQLIFWNCPVQQKYVTARQIWPEDRTHWSDRGVIKLCWAPGLKAKPAPVAELSRKFIDRLNEHGGIFIDEFYMTKEQLPYQVETLCPAVRIARQTCPKQKIYAWTTTIDPECKPINAVLRECVDWVVIEVYLENFVQYQTFSREYQAAYKADLASKSVIGLAVDPRWINTTKEARSQIMEVKRRLPESPGIAFFGSELHPKIFAAIDMAIMEFYIMPVLRLSKDGKFVTNCGGMTARGVHYRDIAGRDCVIPVIAPGTRIELAENATELQAGRGYTILEDKL